VRGFEATAVCKSTAEPDAVGDGKVGGMQGNSITVALW